MIRVVRNLKNWLIRSGCDPVRSGKPDLSLWAGPVRFQKIRSGRLLVHHTNFFGKVIIEILVDQKAPPRGQIFGWVFGPPRVSVPAGTHAHIWACPKSTYLKIGQNQACRYSTCRSRCPEHEDNFLFEIGRKLTELRAMARCPYMGARANFGRFWAITWPNFNIFEWNLFYMINTLELHHISKL